MTSMTGTDELSPLIIKEDSTPKSTKTVDNCKGKTFKATINNYTTIDLTAMTAFLDSLKPSKWIYGFEKGELGTPHLQCYFRFEKETRRTSIKKYFARDFYIDLVKKNKKDTDIKIDTEQFDYCSKSDNYKSNYNPHPKIIKTLRPWQQKIEEIILAPADERKVYWFWEEVGGIGKSAFCKYLCFKYKALYIDEGKKADLINIIYNADMFDNRIVVIDVPRDNGNKVSYKAIEQIKNGMICNTKYETGMKLFNSPHLIIFANFPPEEHKLSADRWVITDLNTQNPDPTARAGGFTNTIKSLLDL